MCAEFFGEFKSVGVDVGDYDVLDAFEFGKLGVEDARDATSNDEHRIVFLKVCQPLSPRHTRQWLNECAFFKTHRVRQFVDAAFNVDFWDLNVLCEAAWVIVGCVKCVAGGVVSSLAIPALVAGYMVGNENAVAEFDACDFAADFTYDPCCFVTKHARRLRHTVPF